MGGIKGKMLNSIDDRGRGQWPVCAASHTQSVTTSSQGTDLPPESDSLAERRSFEDNEHCLKTGIPTENILTETSPLSGLAVKEGHVLRKDQCRLCISGFRQSTQ